MCSKSPTRLDEEPVNLGYAVARTEGYQAALEVLTEGRELIPSSWHLEHALARLHLWGHHANLADPLYAKLAAVRDLDQDLLREVGLYQKGGRIGRKKKKI